MPTTLLRSGGPLQPRRMAWLDGGWVCQDHAPQGLPLAWDTPGPDDDPCQACAARDALPDDLLRELERLRAENAKARAEIARLDSLESRVARRTKETRPLELGQPVATPPMWQAWSPGQVPPGESPEVGQDYLTDPATPTQGYIHSTVTRDNVTLASLYPPKDPAISTGMRDKQGRPKWKARYSGSSPTDDELRHQDQTLGRTVLTALDVMDYTTWTPHGVGGWDFQPWNGDLLECRCQPCTDERRMPMAERLARAEARHKARTWDHGQAWQQVAKALRKARKGHKQAWNDKAWAIRQARKWGLWDIGKGWQQVGQYLAYWQAFADEQASRQARLATLRAKLS